MSKRPKIIRFKIGDRVAEKPKDNYIPSIRPEKIPVVQYNSTQRIGVVTGVNQKQDARKHVCTYYDVTWDNGRSSTHAQFRLCHEHELASVLQNYRNESSNLTTHTRESD